MEKKRFAVLFVAGLVLILSAISFMDLRGNKTTGFVLEEVVDEEVEEEEENACPDQKKEYAGREYTLYIDVNPPAISDSDIDIDDLKQKAQDKAWEICQTDAADMKKNLRCRPSESCVPTFAVNNPGCEADPLSDTACKIIRMDRNSKNEITKIVARCGAPSCTCTLQCEEGTPEDEENAPQEEDAPDL